MKEIDISNKNIIKEYVRKYFSLDKKSLDYFESEIDKPNIDDYFKSLLEKKGSDDYRAYFDIPRDVASNIDEGWREFRNLFQCFVAVNNFNYTNFVENRVLVEKNQIKTRKALLMFYMKYDNLSYAKEDIINKRIAVPTSELAIFKATGKPSSWLEKELTTYIDGCLENISKKCLPKTSIKLVISLNFADWFLCSTAESWRSCLNLESEFHGAYWTGLPGLVGDKNRCMIYVTDGTKKRYKGIEVDKVIARSWGLLSNKNELHMIKPYPLADIINSDMISGIIGLPVRSIMSNRNEYYSKHAVNLLRYNDESRPSVFIFQDFTAFDESAHLIKGHNAFYCFVGNRLKGGEPIVNYTGGFTRLIETNQEVLDYLVKVRECEKCHYTGQEVTKITVEGNEYTLCPSCLSKMFRKCPVCKEWHSIKSMEKIEDSGRDAYVCKKCIGNEYVYCQECRKVYARSNLIHIHFSNGNKISICNNCFDTAYSEMNLKRCDRCGSYHESGLIRKSFLCPDEEAEKFCEKCIKDMNDRRQYKLDFEPKKKGFDFEVNVAGIPANAAFARAVDRAVGRVQEPPEVELRAGDGVPDFDAYMRMRMRAGQGFAEEPEAPAEEPAEEPDGDDDVDF